MSGSSYPRASFMANAVLAAASAVALLSSSAPSAAGDIVVTSSDTWNNSSVIDGNVTFTASNFGFVRNGQTGVINGSITVNSGGKIENFGVITGNIFMPTGYVVNYSGGVINSGSTFNLSSYGFSNYGVLSPGGDDAVQTTSISGDFRQGLYSGKAGSYVTTLASPTSADKLAVTGDATIAGTVVVNRTGSIGNTGQVAILTATGTLAKRKRDPERLGLLPDHGFGLRLFHPHHRGQAPVELEPCDPHVLPGLGHAHGATEQGRNHPRQRRGGGQRRHPIRERLALGSKFGDGPIHHRDGPVARGLCRVHEQLVAGE